MAHSLAATAMEANIGLWDLASGQLVQVLSGHQGSVWSVALSADGTTVASGASDNTVRIWDLATERCLATLAAGPNGWVMFTADGRYKSGGNPREIAAHAIGL